MSTVRLIRAADFAKRYFDPESAPDERTVRAWVVAGHIEGDIVGRNVYVDANAFEARRSLGNPLVDKILTRAKAAHA